jgi:CubicO group peptidase (beta-lactamase class C family)
MNMWQERLEQLATVIEADIARGDYYGVVLKVGRGGRPVFERAIGHAYAGGERMLKTDDVFSLFSVTKAFTNVLVMRAIEEGRFSLNTRVRDVLPEFTGAPRDEATFFHLLTHTAGMPGVWSPKPGMFLDRADGHGAGSHRPQGPQLPDAAARRPVRAARHGRYLDGPADRSR